MVTTVMFIPGILWALVDLATISGGRHLDAANTLRVTQLLTWLVAWRLIRRAPSRQVLRNHLFWLSLTISGFAIGIAWLRPGENVMALRTMVLISLAGFVVFPFEFRRQMINWSVTALGMLTLLLIHHRAVPTVDRSAALINFLLAGALGMIVSRNRAALEHDLDAAMDAERRAIEQREAAAAALRGLQGLIPICAHCHQVRTEAGAWKQLDRYVREHTDADFSHGICPDCLAEHYPDVAGQPARSAGG